MILKKMNYLINMQTMSIDRRDHDLEKLHDLSSVLSDPSRFDQNH